MGNDSQQTWRRLGQIYSGHAVDDMRVSHGAYPTPVVLNSEIVRIFFATRDAQNRSHISSLDIRRDLKDLSEHTLSEKPLLSPGPCGHFDDSGVTPGSLVTVDGQECLLYMGWNLGVTAPFRNSIGLARYNREQNGIERFSDGPFLSRSHEDPVNLSYPFVMKEGGEYLLWYSSDALTLPDKEGMQHVLKLARSSDFCTWSRKKSPQIELTSGELTISRPTLLKIKNNFHMWYCYRKPGRAYQIGYAHSDDLTQWTRRDEIVRFAEGTGEWDAESRCYPYVFELDGRIIMLYSGNRFGRDGFGAAELVGDIQSLESMEM
jgi:hypothetical protein